MIVYLLEYGRNYESGETLGIYDNKELAINHPVFNLDYFIKSYGNCDCIDYWTSDTRWICITTIKLNENLPMYNKYDREKIGFPEFYERTVEE